MWEKSFENTAGFEVEGVMKCPLIGNVEVVLTSSKTLVKNNQLYQYN